MSKIRLHGSSSGYTEIAPVAASGNNTLTLPNDGTIISKDSNGAVGVTSITVGTGVTIGDGKITCDGSALTSINAAQLVGVCTSGLTKTGGFGGGKILQVVQTTKTDTQTIQSQTFTDVSGMSVSITPSATSSKIFVQFSVSIGCNNYGFINLLRGSTDIFKGDADGSRISCTIGSATMAVYECKSYSSSFLDSPNTTSAITYKLQAATPYDASYYIHINRAHTDTNATYLGRMTSQITAMEISA